MSLKSFIFSSKWLFLVMLLLANSPFSVHARVYTGLELFLSRHTNLVKGKRVGLVTNPTGVNGRFTPTVDLFKRNPNINLVALFAPEHGIRGDVRAGENVAGARDPKTKIPIYTLYGGKDHKPRPEHLAKVDVLIYDIQDVGSRAYTYIWHLAECMSACAAVGKTVIVLDRPNPLGANVVDGPVIQRRYLSFIGLYPIPRVYGMTVGELARYLNREERINCRLYVIPMVNYRRNMNWKQTGLPWVPPSPHIPTPEAACCFAATGTIGELGVISIGIGYTLPFQCVASPWINADHASYHLNRLALPGVTFRPIHYQPYYAAYTNKKIQGVQIHVTNPSVFRPSTAEVAILCYLQKYYRGKFKWLHDKFKMFDKATGTSSVRRMIMAGRGYKEITNTWRSGIHKFLIKRQKYLIYK